MTRASSEHPSQLPGDVVTVLIIIQDLARVAEIPRRVLHVFIPGYVLDALDVGAAGS